MSGSGDHAPANSPKTVLRGHEHAQLGELTVAVKGQSLAIAMSAGAVRTVRSIDPNEDVGAIVGGSRADLLVVADAHFGREASELAVDHVLEALGDDPPPANLTDDEVVGLFFDAGLAVQRATGRPDCSHPNSRTTLALALVVDDVVQWAALGDSCIVLAANEAGTRLDVPRSAYLGSGFEMADVAAVLTRGRVKRTRSECLVVATDGLVDAVSASDEDVTAVISGELDDAVDAPGLAQKLVELTLERGADDAVTIAVATRQPS